MMTPVPVLFEYRIKDRYCTTTHYVMIYDLSFFRQITDLNFWKEKLPMEDIETFGKCGIIRTQPIIAWDLKFWSISTNPGLQITTVNKSQLCLDSQDMLIGFRSPVTYEDAVRQCLAFDAELIAPRK